MSISIVVGSYLAAAAAFLLLSILLMTRWRDRLLQRTMLVACMVTAAWAAASAAAGTYGPALLRVAELLEILRGASWSMFLLAALARVWAGQGQNGARPGRTYWMVFGFYLMLLAAVVWAREDGAAGRDVHGFTVLVVGHVAMAVINMVLVEQVYRNLPTEARWATKSACLGIAGLFAYDFFLYSDALLLRRVDAQLWAARGAVDVLVVPLLALSLARNPRWVASIAVSRAILFYTASVLGAATYLLAMAAVGFYLRVLGGTWGVAVQITFLFAACILLFLMLFSGSLRARLKVFISKHFYRYRYDYREEWMRFTRALSEPGPDLNGRALRAIAGLMESPAGALFLRDERSAACEPVCQWNMNALTGALPLDGSVCQYLEQTKWVVDLQELEHCPQKYDGLSCPEWLSYRRGAWLVVPLLLEQRLYGFAVLARPRSAIRLNWETVDLLKIAGTQAASYLAQRESQQALMVARQFESYTRMSTFVVHDIKNLVAQLSLMLSNAERHKGNIEFQTDMIETVDLSVQKMRLLLQKLNGGQAAPSSPHPVCLSSVLRDAVKLKSGTQPKPLLLVEDDTIAVMGDESQLERTLGHLIQNAVEATPRDGAVTVLLRRADEQACIEIRDTGHGMTKDFVREKLFKPFESTKTSGMGIGAFESLSYVRSLSGTINVDSTPGKGTVFRISLPACTQQIPMEEAIS